MQELWRINLFVCVNDGGMVEINTGPPTYGAPYIPRSAGSGRLRTFCVTVLVSAHFDSRPRTENSILGPWPQTT